MHASIYSIDNAGRGIGFVPSHDGIFLKGNDFFDRSIFHLAGIVGNEATFVPWADVQLIRTRSLVFIYG